jgi:site-specific recombinase XerD
VARQPKLRKKTVGKSVYWFTKAGGDTYFGSVEDVTYTEAKKLFADHVQSLSDEKKDNKSHGQAAGDLLDLFLEWVKKHRSSSTYTSRRIYCSRFGDFRVGANKIADLPAAKIQASDLEAFLDHQTDEGLDAQTRLHAETSVRHCWNWATKHPSPIPYLPATFRPFSAVERTHVPQKALTEADLITQAEIENVFFCGEFDLDQFRRHGLGKTVNRLGIDKLRRSGDFTQMLKCYYHTGARTDELASCEVGDFLPRTRQIILGRHKRSRTQRLPTIRHITLNAQALEIFKSHCKGKDPSEKVFLNEERRPWTVRNMAKRFQRLKQIAKALKRTIRDEITVYNFRHLWISEALMAGNDAVTVARMAGTSLAMIERVYGHFSNQHLQEAQERLDQARLRRA